MILRIREAHVLGSHSLRLTFNGGTAKQVDVSPLLEGPVFEPLLDPVFFAAMILDPTCGTVVWPNGADFAPEALYALEAETTPGSLPQDAIPEIDGRGSPHDANSDAAIR
jgi:hypothetical protein